MSGKFGDLINQSANLRTLAPAAVGSQVALMTVISTCTIIVFNVLRPRNKIVYEPKVKYHGGDKKPPPISDSLLGWVSPLLHTKEPVLVEKIGLDAAIFLRFLRMMRWLFTGVALLTCAALIPVNVVYNLQNVNSDDRDALSMLTIRDLDSKVLFVHVAATYIICFIVMVSIWKNWKTVLLLRKQWFRSPEYIQSFYARTLMITQVSKKYQSDEGLRAIFESTGAPYPTTSVHIGRHVGKLPELIEYHNQAVRELEAVLVRYLKDGKIAKERPTRRLGGFMWCGGQKVDAIDFFTAKLKRTESAVEEYRNRIDTRKAENYGFASMGAVSYAHIVANMLRRKHVKGTSITLAPNPKDIIWENLNKTPSEIRAKKTTGWIFLGVVCFFNTIPLFVISILANLASLTSFVHFLQDWSTASPWSFTFISGVLPPAVSALFGFFFPIVVRWLSQYQGALTQSRLDRAVIARYFSFLLISQLVVFTLIGVLFNCVKEIVLQVGQHQSFNEILQNLDKLPGNIQKTYIDQASYWLTYFPLRGFLVLFDLAQILNLVLISFKKYFLGRTPREIRDWTQPADFPYAIYFSNLLFMATVGFVFAPLAPLVAVAAAIVFWVSSWVYKYQLMFVFVTRVETGGRLWNVVINRLLVAVMLMQLLITLTMGLRFGLRSLFWIASLPPIFLILAFKIYCTRVFNPEFSFYIPTEEELRTAHVHSQRADNASNRLGKRFGHPALHQELFTPMVHANMTALLADVYKGKISNEETKLQEYGGTRVDAQVVAGGVRIAGIEQHDLEYDPVMYQRDRGDEWDTRSISSATTLVGGKSDYSVAGRASPAPSKVIGYDRYLAQGSQPEIEMSRLNVDRVPLLTAPQALGQFDPTASRSNVSLSTTYSRYNTPPLGSSSEFLPHVPQVSSVPAMPLGQDYREASLHRPYPSGRQASGNAPSEEANMAGRGAFRNY
ncbi:uncharacterized protein PHACADRAFT_259710 [Phanerochaete carnosa HHB-10118-sp]|uniref:DUF221-domain-containing protein n=1 Tax=Phanerochaete carnosa (strain HHB-10118-sp) TaxID=650164 RepID=K5W2P2_PHACS|nr:uncharacterized protein PHACADRAFT_259710 [Phanerochaete carnosa HHB-10118-sp]EKM53375.1 hypothetical protein PHACADRAFT_259710 [Phanerochaete carnosa HHB-10118-sp]